MEELARLFGDNAKSCGEEREQKRKQEMKQKEQTF